MTQYYSDARELQEMIEFFLTAPAQNPEMIPTILPLVAGLFVIELYFGKHKHEKLGWNTSVGNAVIWVSTGLTLYLTETLSQNEFYATFALIGLGLFVGYMNFFHKWSAAIAFTVSSAGTIYTLAYILVVFVKTDLVPNEETLTGAGAFFLFVIITFKAIKILETGQEQDPLKR